jgi:hypothetical protein
VYVLTWTDSHDIPTTPGSFGEHSLGGRDVYTAIFDANLSQLKMGTRYGASGQDGAAGKRSIVVAANGDFYFGGFTRSSDFHVTPGAAQPTPLPVAPGKARTFIAKMSPTGALIASTFIGTTEGISLDASGNVYFTSQTNLPNFPLTSNAYQTKLKGIFDAVIVNFSSDLQSFLYATYIGGSGIDGGRMSIVDPRNGTLYIAGQTDSSDYPIQNAFQDSYGGDIDAFVTQFVMPPSPLKRP